MIKRISALVLSGVAVLGLYFMYWGFVRKEGIAEGAATVEELKLAVEQACATGDFPMYRKLIYWPDIPNNVFDLVMEDAKGRMGMAGGRDRWTNVEVNCTVKEADGEVPPPYLSPCKRDTLPARYGSRAYFKIECFRKNPGPIEYPGSDGHSITVTYAPLYLSQFITKVSGRYYIMPAFPDPPDDCWTAYSR